MMMASREHAVDYMTPLGLTHLMAHGPSLRTRRRGSTTCRGRTGTRSTIIAPTRRASASTARATGSNAVAQYAPAVARSSRSRERTAERDCCGSTASPGMRRMPSGRTLWDELRRGAMIAACRCASRNGRRSWAGAVRRDRSTPNAMPRSRHARMQRREARWWRDASIAYWQSLSRPRAAGRYAAPRNARLVPFAGYSLRGLQLGPRPAKALRSS